jgi:cytochrome d ubiquinol oxidase subunit II
VPLDAVGYFSGTFAFLLNPYALLVGVFALATLAQHGAAFAALRLDGDLGVRAARMLQALWWAVLPLYLAVTAATFAVHGGVARWLLAMPLLSLAALAGVWWGARSQRPERAFAMSLAFVATLLTAAAGTLFPYLLPAFPAGRGGISIFSAAPSPVALTCALTVTLAGIVIVGIYSAIVWRRMGGKLRAE